MRPNQVILPLLLAAVALHAAGCSPAGKTAAASPADSATLSTGSLTLDVLVFTAADHAGQDDPAAPPSARYILLPDGALHAEIPARPGTMSMPPRVRRLSAAERDQLRLLTDAALADDTLLEPPIDLQSIRPPRQGTLITIVAAGDDARTMLRTPRNGHAIPPPVQALADAVADLAWTGEPPAPARAPAPIRYDLGPDPYQRYRRSD